MVLIAKKYTHYARVAGGTAGNPSNACRAIQIGKIISCVVRGLIISELKLLL